MQSVFNFEIPFRVAISEMEEEVERRELFERNNCVWYADGFKRHTVSGVGPFEMRMGESVSLTVSLDTEFVS